MVWLACLAIECAETQVAVGQERAHAELVCQSKGLAVAGFGLFDLRGITMCGNVAEEAHGIRLPPSLLVGTGMLEGTEGKGVRLLQAAGVQMRLAQGEELSIPNRRGTARGGLLERPFEQPHRLVNTPTQDIRGA